MSFFWTEHWEQSSRYKFTAWWQLQACALFNFFKQGFNCIADIKILILVANKNTLKATETGKFFMYILPRTQIHSHQFDAVALPKKNVWRSLRWQFRAIWTGQICKIYPLDANHVGASWVSKLVESMNKWPTTLSKLISITVFTGQIFIFIQVSRRQCRYFSSFFI